MLHAPDVRGSAPATRPLRPAGREWTAIGIAIAAVAFGLLALWLEYGPRQIGEAIPWLIAGLTLFAAGIAAHRTRLPGIQAGLLLATGASWFLPAPGACLNIEPIAHRCFDINLVAGLFAVAGLLWLGTVAQSILAFPTGIPESRTVAALVIAVYAMALAWSVGFSQAPLMAAVVLIVTPFVRLVARMPRKLADDVVSCIAGSTVGIGLLLGAVGGTETKGLAIALAVVGLTLGAGFVSVIRRATPLTVNTAVELGPALSAAVADPRLSFAIRDAKRDRWLDASGRVISDAVVTFNTTIERDGVIVAAIRHEPATLADPNVRAAVVTAIELAAHNALLRADLDDQAAALAASRRRLVDAGLAEREALGREIEADVVQRLDGLTTDLDQLAHRPLPAEILAAVAQATEVINVARTEIRQFAQGVFPARPHAGLPGALADLARSELPLIAVDAEPGLTGGHDVDATLYLVCTEAIANVIRHANAGSITVGLVCSMPHA